MISENRLDVESILEEAKTFYKNVKRSGMLCTYNDYERFKHILHDNGWFGYEYKLASILHL